MEGILVKYNNLFGFIEDLKYHQKYFWRRPPDDKTKYKIGDKVEYDLDNDKGNSFLYCINVRKAR